MQDPEHQGEIVPAHKKAESGFEDSGKKINAFKDGVNQLVAELKQHPESKQAKLFDLNERNISDLDQRSEAKKSPSLEDGVRNSFTTKIEGLTRPWTSVFNDDSDASDSYTSEQLNLLKAINDRANALRGAFL